jgi:hypothetical protein
MPKMTETLSAEQYEEISKNAARLAKAILDDEDDLFDPAQRAAFASAVEDGEVRAWLDRNCADSMRDVADADVYAETVEHHYLKNR